MKVLFISLNQKDVDEFKKAPTDISALGVRYLSSYLKSKGHLVNILFLAKSFGKLESQSELNQINELIKDLKPDLIGLSLMSNHFFRAKAITNFIKKEFSIPIIWGGIHPTICPQDCLECADMICVGEGELAMAELVDNLSSLSPEIQGIWYKKDGQIVARGVATLLDNIEDISYPDYNFSHHYIIHNGRLLAMTENIYRQYYPASNGDHRLISSRGCPHSCAYCCNSTFSKMYGSQFMRLRSVDSLINEMVIIKNQMPFIRSFKIMDDSFMVNSSEWMREFSYKYKEKINLPFFCLVSPLTLTQEKLELLINAGLKSVQMGLQSASEHINKEYYLRYVTRSKFLSAARLLENYKSKIKVVIDVIVDNPYEKEENILETIAVLNVLEKSFNLAIFSLSFYPGTALFERAIKDNLLVNSEEYLTKQFHLLNSNYLNKVVYLVPHLKKDKIDQLSREDKSLINRMYVNTLFSLYRNKNKVPYWLVKFASKVKKYATP